MERAGTPEGKIEAYVRRQLDLVGDRRHRAVVAISASELDAGAREKIRAAHGGLIAMIVEALGDLGHEQPRLAAMLLQGVGGRRRAPYRAERGGGTGRDRGGRCRHGPAGRPGLTPGPEGRRGEQRGRGRVSDGARRVRPRFRYADDRQQPGRAASKQ